MGRKRTIHLVPHFHYDIEYLLPMEPYLEICFENLVEAHRLLRKYPRYTFLVEQVFLMEQFLNDYPSLASDMAQWAREGRLEIASGMYAMADINMASGESILRQLVVGKKWCAQKLGCGARVLNMGDCTGHPAQMPQIARHCGYDYFVFMRAVDTESRKSEILWKGIDGTELKTCWLPRGYSGWTPPSSATAALTGQVPSDLETMAKISMDGALSGAVILAHGGDFRFPFEQGLPIVDRWNETHPDCQILYSTYTRALDAMEWDKAAPYSGEFNPDRTGCYSSRIRIKQNNRMCEALCMTAEAAAVLAQQRLGMAPDNDGLAHAWKLTFINQFHDIIWGTIVDRAYDHALDRAGRVRTVTARLIEDRLQAILDVAPQADGDARRVIVFNPLPWSRKADVRIPDEERAAGMDFFGSDKEAEGRTERVALPPCGYRVLHVPRNVEADADGSAKLPFAVSSEQQPAGPPALDLQTPHYEARIEPSGNISSLVRRRDALQFADRNRPWLNTICMERDKGDLWQYYEGPINDGPMDNPNKFARDLIKAPYPLENEFTKNGHRLLDGPSDNRAAAAKDVRVREMTSDRLVIGVKGQMARYWPNFREFREFGIRIHYEQTITFRADTPRIDFHLRTRHERARWYRMRAAFFTDIENGRIVHEIPFGRFEREEGEFAAQNYLAYVGAQKGLALFNRGLPGNNVNNGVVMLALMRSVSIYSRAESTRAFEEGETHDFDYAILPFAGEKEFDAPALAREGLEFAVPPYVYEDNPSRMPVVTEGRAEAADELLSVDNDAICCTAIYPDGDDVIIRLYESRGQGADACVELNFDVSAAEEADAMLEQRREVPVTDGTVALSFRPFEIKTMVIRT